jgi:4,5-dihydroxyphthalate decarboxylase
LSRTLLTIQGDDYPATRALAGLHGDFRFAYTPRPLMEAMQTVLACEPFQASEFSLSYTIQMIDQGKDWITPVPVFPLRAFRHTAAYVRKDSDLAGPAGLDGKRIGIPDYSMTGAVWLRGIWRDMFGLDWSSLKWHLRPAQRIAVPPGIDVTYCEGDPEDMLINGDLDILVGLPSPRDASSPQAERLLRPLFPDIAAAQMDYLSRTGYYPIAHTVVLHSDMVAANPGAARAVFDAYSASKRAAYDSIDDQPVAPWPDFLSRTGGDPMIFGLTDTNRAIVETLARYVFEQKLTSRLIAVDEIFTGGWQIWRED